MNISAQVLVDREVVKEVGRGDEQEIVFFSRHRGLFRVCFPGTEQGEFEERSKNNDLKMIRLSNFLKGKRPDKHPEIFLSLVEDWCISRDYRFVRFRYTTFLSMFIFLALPMC